MPRFVVLTHDHPFPHWDLLLEAGDVLRAWRLLREPTGDAVTEAEPLADHRLAYLDYEGPVSGNRGTVARWDRGEHEILEESAGCVVTRLRGARLAGVYELRDDGGRQTFQRRPYVSRDA